MKVSKELKRLEELGVCKMQWLECSFKVEQAVLQSILEMERTQNAAET